MYVSDLHGECFGSLAPSVHIRHLRSPGFGTDAPFATSYSIRRRDWREGMMEIAPHIDLGMTVSEAPVSAVNSTSIHSVVDGLTGLKLALLASV